MNVKQTIYNKINHTDYKINNYLLKLYRLVKRINAK